MEPALISAISGLTPGALGIWLFGTVLVSGQILKWVTEYRSWRKLPLEQQQANREGFTAQVDLLTKQLAASDEENRRTRAEISGLRKEYDDYRGLCHHETDQLRNQVVHLENRISGLLRKVADVAIRAARGEMNSDTAQLILQIAADAATPIHPESTSHARTD